MDPYNVQETRPVRELTNLPKSMRIASRSAARARDPRVIGSRQRRPPTTTEPDALDRGLAQILRPLNLNKERPK
jgi:hypothetical protein